MVRKVIVDIEIAGDTITPISQLTLNQPLNGHHTFELRCPLREQDRSLMEICSQYLSKEIKMEFRSGKKTSGEPTFFRGIVTSIRLAKEQAGLNEVVFIGKSPTCLLEDGAHCQSFLEKSIGDIAKTLLDKYELQAQINPRYTSTVPYFVQYKEDGFHFLYRMATLFGEWFYYDGTQIIFGKPQSDDALELKFGRDVHRVNLALQLEPTSFKLLGYDYLNHRFPESAASAVQIADLDEYGDLVLKASEALFHQEPTQPAYHSVLNQQDLNKQVEKQRHAQTKQMVILQGVSDYPGINVGKTIKLVGTLAGNGIKDTDYGQFVITEITHVLDGIGNYQSNFKAIPASVEAPPPYPSSQNPMCEIQPAEVLDNNDPEGLGRVIVQSFWQKPQNEKTPWIRVASSQAGGTHGFFSVPEKGDQVLVGYEHQNPNRPYVIGSLYHGKAKPDGVKDASNNKKVIKTKSGNQIFFSDEGGNEEVKIINGTNTLVLSLSGDGKISISTQGTLELSGKKVVISAKEEMEISAGKNIKVTADQNISLTSKQDTSVTATGKIITTSDKDTEVTSSANLSLKATKEATLKGDISLSIDGGPSASVKGANLSLNGDMAVTVKGGMIKLN